MINDGQVQPDLNLHMAARVLRLAMSAHERPISHDSFPADEQYAQVRQMQVRLKALSRSFTDRPSN